MIEGDEIVGGGSYSINSGQIPSPQTSPPAPSTIRLWTRRAKRFLLSLHARVSIKWDRRAALAVIANFPNIRTPRHHGLPAPLIVSLTSYPARYPVLPNTLKAILSQTLRADRTILWIAHDEMPALTPEILELRAQGLEILACEDLRSYNKIIPTLELSADSFIVTIDDDLYYEPNLLETLVSAYDPMQPAIICRRAHRPARNKHGELRRYEEWEWHVVDHRPTTTDLFPTGVGGVLYPPGSLAPEVTDRATIRQLCPTADDIWLYWMGRRAGVTYRQVGPYFRAIEWHGTQATSLFFANKRGRNDAQMRALRDHFGPV